MAKQSSATSQKKTLLKLIEKYYADLADFARQNVLFEMGTRHAFHRLLADAGKPHGWTLIAEQEKKVNGKTIRPDGTFKDGMNLVRGFWEAKDTADKLDAEIEKKRKAGYPLSNIIFEDTQTAVLFQHGERILSVDMKTPDKLAELVVQFFRYVEPEIEEFEHAVDEFKERVPDLAEGLAKKIEQAHRTNPAFKKAFADFFELCQTSLNPNISQAAVDEMLIQHILTERLIREIFDNPEFVRRNVIAAEVEKVMLAMTSHSFDRNTYLRDLDRFYASIERAARTMTDWSDKQYFLNTVYERFFQGYSVKLADTMGIVYTPQEIVDFMCASVAEVLEKEFGKKLWSDDVYIIDPCTGTGNFIVNLIRRIPKAKLEGVYKHRLFANEIMLLPYYIAALNIEHAFFEQTGKYESFEGLCFVDSLDLGEHAQAVLSFLTAKNSERVERQRNAPITVILGNPPYNVGQYDENENNKNRRYPILEKAVSATYAESSQATNKNALSDAYVKFVRWATDRFGERDGILCFVTNNSFVHQPAFDGMRFHLRRDFDAIYHLDLHGNVRINPKLSGTTHNVFGIQVGVGITIAVRRKKQKTPGVFYHRVPENWTRIEKLEWLESAHSTAGVTYQQIAADSKNRWIIPLSDAAFRKMIPTAVKPSADAAERKEVIFPFTTGGVKSNRDDVVYDFDVTRLRERVTGFIEDYNAEIDRFNRAGRPKDVDEFVKYDRIKWSRDLKLDLVRGNSATFEDNKIRVAMYRPFCRQYLFLDRVLNEEVYSIHRVFPDGASNFAIVSTSDLQIDYSAIIVNIVPCLHLGGRQGPCFPFYVYDEDGTNRRENITDWALKQFRDHYQDQTIDKWAIFHYVYGLLHHSGYRQKFADNLKRELPRIPFAPPAEPEPRTSVSDYPASIPVDAAAATKAQAERKVADSAKSEEQPAAQTLTNVRGSESTARREKQPDRHSDCLAYLITFHTYGSWLHGTVRGSVDPKHNRPGTEFLPPNVLREQSEFHRLKTEPVHLDAPQRTAVDSAIREVSEHRSWYLHALNVRTNHVHVVVTAPIKPERVMNDFKAYATRALRKAGLFAADAQIWSRHGSNPYLWTEESVERACQYVLEGQGIDLPFAEYLAETVLSEPRTSVSDQPTPIPVDVAAAITAQAEKGVDEGAPSEQQQAGQPLTDVRGSGRTRGSESSGFWAFANAGKQLARLHLDYETLEPWPLEVIEAPGVPLSYRVEDKMRLSKDKLRLTVNRSLTLAGIPPAALEYRLGNRSALEWVIDQYQVSTDKRSGIMSDPNREDDPEYIVRLVGQVVRVSLETVSIVNALPAEFAPT